MILEWLKEIGVSVDYSVKKNGEGIIDVKGNFEQIAHIAERLDANGYVNDALALARMLNPKANITGKFDHMFIYQNEKEPNNKGYMLLGF